MKIQPITIVNIILIIIILIMVGRSLYFRVMAKLSATWLEEADFRENMRKAQVIDLREKPEFKAGHIMGARNMPYTTFKESLPSLRHDQPIYLYDQKKTMSIRAANVLRKKEFNNVFILKGGYDGWTGRVKKDN